MHCISEEFYNALQKEILFKTIWLCWCLEQKAAIEELKCKQNAGYRNSLSGDGKYDSPGKMCSILHIVNPTMHRILCKVLYLFHSKSGN